MNARDRVRKAIAKIGIGVSFRATDLPDIHNIHDILSSLYDNDELELVSFEVHIRGHQKYERRIYAATELLKEVEEPEYFAEKWTASAWESVMPELFTDPKIKGILRVITFEDLP